MAMMKRSTLFASLLVVGIVAAMATPMVQAQLGLLGNLLGLIRVQGTLFCTLNGNIGLNGTSTPVFPNALVQLRCGSQNVISTAITNGSGVFSILLDPLQVVLSTLLSNCNLAVNTPLVNCNASLPSVGGLLSPLQFVGTTAAGLLNVVNIVPAGFQFLSGTALP